jgi:hypothetical protein
MTCSLGKNYVTALPAASMNIVRGNHAIANERLKAVNKRLGATGMSKELTTNPSIPKLKSIKFFYLFCQGLSVFL